MGTEFKVSQCLSCACSRYIDLNDVLCIFILQVLPTAHNLLLSAAIFSIPHTEKRHHPCYLASLKEYILIGQGPICNSVKVRSTEPLSNHMQMMTSYSRLTNPANQKPFVVIRIHHYQLCRFTKHETTNSPQGSNLLCFHSTTYIPNF